ncbi:hypothetical protein EON62_02840, partial [archaeon]
MRCAFTLCATSSRLAQRSAQAAQVELRVCIRHARARARAHMRVRMCGCRYKLIGDTVNTASRMESTCAPGCIQISEACRAELEFAAPQQFLITPRGTIDVKGKGQMFTYWLQGYAGQSPVAPPPLVDPLLSPLPSLVAPARAVAPPTQQRAPLTPGATPMPSTTTALSYDALALGPTADAFPTHDEHSTPSASVRRNSRSSSVGSTIGAPPGRVSPAMLTALMRRSGARTSVHPDSTAEDATSGSGRNLTVRAVAEQSGSSVASSAVESGCTL